jgi:hypothetical protein
VCLKQVFKFCRRHLNETYAIRNQEGRQADTASLTDALMDCYSARS